jgi:GNAT superfamily N-acetyltransferase
MSLAIDPLVVLPPAPAGMHWRVLGGADGGALARHWQDVNAEHPLTPFWRDWNEALIDCRTGRFDAQFVCAVGLFDGDEALVACVSEAVSRDDAEVSEVAFSVDAGRRGLGYGRVAIEAALALARLRGSRAARIECQADNAACLALFAAEGLSARGAGAAGQSFCRVLYPLAGLSSFTHRLRRVFAAFTG